MGAGNRTGLLASPAPGAPGCETPLEGQQHYPATQHTATGICGSGTDAPESVGVAAYSAIGYRLCRTLYGCIDLPRTFADGHGNPRGADTLAGNSACDRQHRELGCELRCRQCGSSDIAAPQRRSRHGPHRIRSAAALAGSARCPAPADLAQRLQTAAWRGVHRALK